MKKRVLGSAAALAFAAVALAGCYGGGGGGGEGCPTVYNCHNMKL